MRAFVDDKLDMTPKIRICSRKGKKKYGKKYKMLVTSIFSFYLNIYIGPLLHGREKSRLYAKRSGSHINRNYSKPKSKPI